MSFTSNQNNSPKTSFTAAELFTSLQNGEDILLIDIREPQELAQKGIENSIHIPMGQIPSKIPELPKDKLIVVFCHLGFRSKQVRNYMQHIGFYNVAHLKGGLNAWNRELKTV